MNNHAGRVSDSVTRQETESVMLGATLGYATLTRPTRLHQIDAELEAVEKLITGLLLEVTE